MSDRNVYAPPAAQVADVPETGSPLGYEGERPPFFPVSVLKLVLLSGCTFGLYELYWFYKNWQYIKEREGLDIRPFWRVFFGYFFCYQFFSKVRDYDRPELELSFLPAGPLTAGWILVTMLWRLPEPYWLLSNFAVVFLIPVQTRVNHVNNTVAPGHDRNSRLTWANWLVLVLGGGLLILDVIGSLAGPS
jgi:hypothetical protein